MARPRTAAGRCRRTHMELKVVFPEAECELNFRTPFQLLTATILSAQATDVSVNKVTPALFKRYPDPESLAASGVTQSYVRLCIGLEHIDDIIDDLDQALNKSSKGSLKAVS